VAAIKAAMKGEMDSVTVYEDAAKASEGEVRGFFEERAAQERSHFNYLLGYYRTRTVNLTPERSVEAELKGDGWRSAITSREFLAQVAASRHLTAAIASAIHLEADSIRLYRDWSARSENPELRELLKTLVEWEERHYADLLVIQEELERHWFDINQFEPF
ncbi:MAG TPA: ferritin family protein, partial [Spirochaetales bacterium]|nr:ferritin family protein [Spirochaetales bacterium]